MHTCPRVQSTERDKTHIFVAVMWLYFLQSLYCLQSIYGPQSLCLQSLYCFQSIYVPQLLYCLQSIYPLQERQETKHTCRQLADNIALSHDLWNKVTFPVSNHGPVNLILQFLFWGTSLLFLQYNVFFPQMFPLKILLCIKHVDMKKEIRIATKLQHRE